MPNFFDHTVNQRFRKVYNYLEKTGAIKGKSDIAKKLGTYNHVINSILKGQRNITVDQLLRLMEHYGINANFLFGQSEIILNDPPDGDIPIRSLYERRDTGRSNIVLVPERAMAGYAVEHQDEAYLDQLQRFSVPGLEGELTAFEINGDSMLPTVTSGDLVICEALDPGDRIYDNHVYVIVTDIVVAKRVQQVREEDGVTALRLISDNHSVYRPYEVELEEVRQLLKVKWRLTDYAIS
jgi:transcriptional regulator with XRE-family HTH domain